MDVPRRPDPPGDDVGRPVTVVVVRGDAEVASWPLDGGPQADLHVVNDLARLHLAALRVGCAIRLRDATGALWELIDLSGLRGILVDADGGAPSPSPSPARCRSSS